MYDLILGLSDRGVDCDMMCAETNGFGKERNLDTGARILSFHTWAKVASTTIAPSMVNTLWEKASEYDLIHVHHPDPMAAFALRMSGYKGPVVLHWHADILKSAWMMKLYEPLQEWLLHRADAIITTSPIIAEDSSALARYHNKVRVIPIGINPIAEDPVGAALIRDELGYRKIVFSLGRLVAYKGFQHLINAAALLPKDYVVVIGGDGPLRGKLEKLRDATGLRERIVFKGNIPDEQLPAFYTACDVFCLPSIMKTEAFGIVQIEAMSLGKPIVATKIEGSGTSWVNADGVSGLNVNPGSSLELAMSIYSIVKNPIRYYEYSVGAKERFDKEFTLTLMVDRCYSLYTDLINNKK